MQGQRGLEHHVLGTVLPAEFLLQGLVRKWGMTFPRWTLGLSGKRVPRFLPLTPVWLTAPTLAAYGTGAWIYLILQFTGVLNMNGSPSEYLLGCAAATALAGLRVGSGHRGRVLSATDPTPLRGRPAISTGTCLRYPLT